MSHHSLVDDWKNLVVQLDSTFKEALEVINSGGYQLALVRNEDWSLAGMITDSDIRKSLLKGLNLDSNIQTVMNANPLVVSSELTEEEAIRMMRLNHFFHLPVVDSKRRLCGLHVSDNFLCRSIRREAFVIMAGGRGKRLMPLTTDTPKPLLPVKGLPMIDHIIRRAEEEGFRNIFISVNYLADRIINHCGSGTKYGVSIEYLREDSPLGTAGCLSMLPKSVKEFPLIVTNADLVTDLSYLDMISQFYRDRKDALVTTKVQEWQNPYGVIESNLGKIVDIQEKPIHHYQISAGIYVLGKKLIEMIPDGNYLDMPDLIKKGIHSHLDIGVFPMHESWLDIGLPKDYASAQ